MLDHNKKAQDDPSQKELKFILELFNSNKLLEANKEVDKQLIKYSKSAILYNILGAIFARQYKLKDALLNYNKSLKINPKYFQAYNNLGACFYEMGKIDEAIQNYKKAIEIKPNHADAHNNLGVTFKAIKNYEKSIFHYKKALEINPSSPITFSNIGNVYRLLGDYEKAINYHKKAIQINPNYAEAYSNLGVSFQLTNEIEKALEYFDKALEIDPDFSEAQHNKSLLMLLNSDFEKGFNKYEWRKKILSVDFYKKNTPKTQEWTGEDLTNKTILIIAEQGVGDVIQFSRYIYIIKENYSAKIIFKVQKKLAHLFSNSGIEIISEEDKIPEHDHHIFLMSLPKIFYSKKKSLPKQINYIAKNENIFLKWKKKLGKINGIKVGINWQGNSSYFGDRLRSIPLSFFETLFTVEKINFINLQKGIGAEQIKNFKYKDKLYDFSSEVDNGKNAFEDTIGILNNIDLVISSDTALPHLSGTLGIKTWVMVPFIPDWRYFLKTDYSPWYEHMKIYRNEKSNNWNKVFDKVKKNLINEFND